MHVPYIDRHWRQFSMMRYQGLTPNANKTLVTLKHRKSGDTKLFSVVTGTGREGNI